MQPLKLATSYLVHNLGLREITFSTKISGGLDRGASKNAWDPYLFLQPLKVATSNLVNSLGSGCSLPRNNF